MSLSPDARAFVASLWLGRARAEARAVPAFATLARDLITLGAPDSLRQIALRAIDEEAEHAQLCLQLASSYAGRALEMPHVDYAAPTFPAAPPEMQPLLRVLLVCAISETLSSSFLELAYRRATASEPRRVLHHLLGDEIDHARLGWATLALPTITSEMRALVGGYLPMMAQTMLDIWHSAPRSPHDVAAHGCPPWDETNAHIRRSMVDLVLPGFALLGVDIAPAQNVLST